MSRTKRQAGPAVPLTIFTILLLSGILYLTRGHRQSPYYTVPAGLLALNVFFALMRIILYFAKRRSLLNVSMRKIDRMSGVEFEQYLKMLYEKKGYRVKLTPGSNDYGADLILQKNGQKIAVQAKRYRSRVNEAAVQQVIAAREYYHADRAAVVTNSLYTGAAEKLARECGVILINRYSLGRDFGENERNVYTT